MVSFKARVVGGGAFILYMGYVTRPGSTLFSWHPFLMSVAYTGLMTEAVFTFSKSSLSSGEPRDSKVTNHWILLAAAAVVNALGYYAIYYTKEANSKPHLTSPHACLGCIASVLLWIQLSGGIFAKYPKLLRSFISLRGLRTAHSLTGCVTYAAGVVALILSLGTVWYRENAGVWSIGLVLALHLLFLYSAFKGHAKKYALSSK